MKKIGLLFATVFMIMLFAFSASAEYYGNYEYTVLENNTVEICDYTGSETTLVIPEEINGKSVTSIGSGAFYSCEKIESITIPESVTSIGNAAFQACRNLASITIPEGITSIGSFMFSGCSALKSLTIPDSVTSIGANAFSSCSSLKNITIPEGVTSIGNFAFYHCRALEEITIPDSVKTLGNYVFGYCESLESIALGNSVTSIISTFYYCTSLKSVTIPDSVTNISSSAFYNCESLEFVTLGNGATSIEPFTFKNCYSLKSITIPYGVTNIGYSAFENCISLEDITLPNSVTSIDYLAFANCESIKNFTIPNSVTNLGDTMFSSCTSLESVTIGNGVTSIKFSTFYDCTSLKNITFSDKVTSIGTYAFYNCTSLESITIPDSVTSIGRMAFDNCTSLKSIIIPDGVTIIDEYTFFNCTSLETITVPSSLNSIKLRAFGNTKVKYVFFAGTESQKNNITVNEDGNTEFFNDAIWHYKSTNHSYSPYQIINDATCTTVGTKHRICSVCKHIDKLTVEKTPHNYNTVIEKATFTQNGKIEIKCNVCGDVESSTTIYSPKTIKLSSSKVTYNGKVRSPSVTVKDSNGNTLIFGTDYDISTPSGRKTPGQYTYTIKFKGNYEGEKKLTFTILPKAPTTISATQSTSVIKLTWSESVGATGYRVYQYSPSKGKYVQIASVKGVTSYRKTTNLKAGTEYKFKVKPYTKLSDGTVLWGVASEAFATATECKAPTIKSVTSPSKSKATVKWSNVDGETGYQLYYSTKKDSGYKKINSYSANTLTGTKTFSASASGKTIYFKVRAYKKVNGQTIYGQWSAVKSVKVK